MKTIVKLALIIGIVYGVVCLHTMSQTNLQATRDLQDLTRTLDRKVQDYQEGPSAIRDLQRKLQDTLITVDRKTDDLKRDWSAYKAGK
jgi:hypothetical protein